MDHENIRKLSVEHPDVNFNIIGSFGMTGATMSHEKMESKYEFLCTPQQRAAWEDAASRDGRKLSQWIRHVLDREAARSSVEPGKHFPEFPEKS